MKLLVIALSTLSFCAACGGHEGAEQNATERSADLSTDPYPAAPPDPGEPPDSGETPAETRRDVDTAREEARDAGIQTDAASRIVEADSARQVRVERCHALEVAERKQCIAKANAEFERVKERVRKELDEDLKR